VPKKHIKSRCITEGSKKELNKNTHIKTPYSTLKCIKLSLGNTTDHLPFQVPLTLSFTPTSTPITAKSLLKFLPHIFMNAQLLLVVVVFTHGDRQVVTKLFPDPGFSTTKKSIYNIHFKHFRHNDKLHRHNS